MGNTFPLIKNIPEPEIANIGHLEKLDSLDDVYCQIEYDEFNMQLSYKVHTQLNGDILLCFTNGFTRHGHNAIIISYEECLDFIPITIEYIDGKYLPLKRSSTNFTIKYIDFDDSIKKGKLIDKLMWSPKIFQNTLKIDKVFDTILILDTPIRVHYNAIGYMQRCKKIVYQYITVDSNNNIIQKGQTVQVLNKKNIVELLISKYPRGGKSPFEAAGSKINNIYKNLMANLELNQLYDIIYLPKSNNGRIVIMPKKNNFNLNSELSDIIYVKEEDKNKIKEGVVNAISIHAWVGGGYESIAMSFIGYYESINDDSVEIYRIDYSILYNKNLYYYNNKDIVCILSLLVK